MERKVTEPKSLAWLGRLHARITTSFFSGLKTIQLSPFVKDILFTTITSLITTLSAVVVTRLLAEGLGPEGFGAYSLSRRTLVMISSFSLLGMDLAIARHIAISKDDETRDRYLLSGSLLGVLPSLLILTIGLMLRQPLAVLIFRNETYACLFAATLLLVVSYAFFIVLYAFYRGANRMSRANLWQIGVVGIGPVGIAWSLAESGRVEIIVLLLATLFFCAVVPLAYYNLKAILYHRSVLELNHPARELLEYGLPRVPAGLALAGMLGLGPFLASHVGGLEEAGYLAAGQSVLSLVQGGVAAFGLVALPKVAQLAAAGKRELLRTGINDIIAFIFHLGLFATLHIFLWADQVVLILLGSQYGKAIPLMRIILLALVPYLSFVLLRSIVDAVEKKAINTLNLFMSFAISLISILLLVWMGFGVKGLALGTVIGFSALGVLTIRYLWRTFQLSNNPLELQRSLLLNVGFITIAFILKYWLVQIFSGLMLVSLVTCVEGALFALFILMLWKIKVRWLVELNRRVIRKPIGE